MVKHFQCSQYSKFAMSCLQYLLKGVTDEVDCLIVYKHQIVLQGDTIITSMHY